MNLKRIGIALVASIGLAQSQTETPSTPKFEVASVKPNKSPDLSKGLLQLLPGGRFVATNIPLIRVIAAAWNLPLQSQRLTLASGVRMPDDIYDIQATADNGTLPPGLTREARVLRMRLMLQALLEDRFKLRIRREPKEQPVYALVVGNGGFHGASVTIANVVEYVNDFTDRPLFDKTGLTGFYNVQTQGWAPMNVGLPGLDGAPHTGGAGVDNSERPTLFDVFEKLGLQVESQRAVIDVFVIDHVERPSEN